MVVETPLTSSSVSVNQMRLVVAQAVGDFAAGALAERTQFGAPRRAEGVEVGGEPEGQRHERTDELQALDETPGLQLGDELREEAEGELVDQQVGREEGAALGLGHSPGRFFDSRAHARLAHRIGQFFPERGVAGQGHFPDFSGGDALGQEAELFREGEARRVLALHETAGHFLEQGGGGFLRVLREALAGEFEDDAVKAVGHDERPAPLAAGTANPLAHRGQKFRRRSALGLGPSATLVNPAFVVRAAGEHLAPRFVPQRRDIALRSKALDVGRGQSRQGELGNLTEQGRAQAVDRFEMAEEQNEPLPVVHGESLVDRPERMGHGVGDTLLFQPAGQLVDVAPQILDLAVLCLGDAPGKKMHFDVILGKKSGDFLAEKHTGTAGNLEATVDRVMVGEGDIIETLLPQRLIQFARLRAAGRKVDFAQQPVGGPRTVAGMEVQVGAGHESTSLAGPGAHFTPRLRGPRRATGAPGRIRRRKGGPGR